MHGTTNIKFSQDIPSHATKLQSTAPNREYRTEKSKSFFLGMTSGHCHWSRVSPGWKYCNKLCGIAYWRGNRADYDDWKALGTKDGTMPTHIVFLPDVQNKTIPAYDDTKYHSTKANWSSPTFLTARNWLTLTLTFWHHASSIQDVTGRTDQTSGECSLGQTIPI